MTDERLGISDLADKGGVSRRTVRYYVQEGLLPPPFGVGRGDHYGRAHVDRLLQIKALQEAGRTLDDIRRLLGDSAAASPASVVTPAPLPRSVWRRIPLAPGIELHIADDVRLPGPGRLQELAAWCRRHFSLPSDEDPDA